MLLQYFGHFLRLCIKGLKKHTLHKKSFPLKISSVNLSKSAGFGDIYRRNPYGKISFFVNDIAKLLI